MRQMQLQYKECLRFLIFLGAQAVVSEADGGFIRLGIAKNSLVITQYTSNSGGGVQTTPGSLWSATGFAPWTVQFTTAYASMIVNFSEWSSVALELSASHSVQPATQSTQIVSGEVSFEVDRDFRVSQNGNFALQVVELATGTVFPSGSTLRRNTVYVLKMNQNSSGVGFSATASTSIGLTLVPPLCPGDVSENGTVDGIDLAAVLDSWGTAGVGEFVTDVDGDGIVAGEDLSAVLAAWGACGSHAKRN
jgi:hypothetical protein